ncbi:MAG: hypothetical protein AB7N76_03240 [Planctomycetota bacterium]
MDEDEPNLPLPSQDILEIDELRELRARNPEGLYRHLDRLCQRFLFGVERREEGWGGAYRVLINRNLSLHLAHGFDDEMPDLESLPQFCAMPSDERPDQAQDTTQDLGGGETLRGVLFWVDPFDFDDLLRDAGRIAEEYPDWDAIPDSYYLDSELVRWLTRTVLEHPTLAAEREFDFRLGLPGLVPPELPEEEMLSAADLISGDDDDDDRDEDDDDELPPLTGMRSHPVGL